VYKRQNGTYTSLINTGFWVEKMLAFNDEIWCTAPDKDKVFFLNPNTNAITDSLTLSLGVNDLGIDANNDFWILSQSVWNEPSIEPALHHVDGETKELLATYTFPTGTGFGGSLEMSNDKQSVLYLIGGKVYKMAITATSLPSEPFIEKSGGSFYTISVNDEKSEIALTDALDYSQSGKVYFYNFTGVELDSYATGILSRSVLWLKD